MVSSKKNGLDRSPETSDTVCYFVDKKGLVGPVGVEKRNPDDKRNDLYDNGVERKTF